MNEIYKQLYKNAPIENKMIYEYLEKHQELLGINSKVKQKFLWLGADFSWFRPVFILVSDIYLCV